MVVTKEEFLEWRQNPITQKLMQALQRERQEMLEMVVYGCAEPEQVKGRIKAIDSFLGAEYADLFEQKRN